MRDFRIVSARHVLKIHSIAPIRGFLPPAIVVLGTDLNKATEVFYNDLQSPSFFIQSPSRLIVQIPEAAVGKNFENIKVYSSVRVSKRDAILDLAIQRTETISGIDRLVQSWLMIFLTTPGSDIFEPDSGGGGQAIIGRQTDLSGKGASADLALAVERTKTELLRKQSKYQSLPLSEKLLNAALEQIVFDPKTGTLSARISIQNMLGDQAEVSVG